MPLAPGTQLGPYEILGLIGSGGMGEVYRARDPRLNRDVAIKVSAAQFSERFEREARAVAALNHPNICTLFDVGPNYLVMELVEGESPKGPLPLETALDYARQIAAALEEAHDKGIVHRDLKPGNVKITPGGTVKVLDFGLAKYTNPAREGGMSENSPTISMAATQAGVILGTAAYMSPEQAKGKQVDKRADIWAFGVVLYEMVTGRQPFHCDDVSETLAAVIMKDPELEPVPAELRKLLKRCLEKDPKKRLRDITGMELLLESGLQPAQDFSPAPSRPRFALIATATAAGAFFLALAALAYVHFRETPPAAEVTRFQIPPPEKSSFTGTPYLSPDGRKIAFTAPDANGRNLVWIRTLDSIQMRSLTGTEDPANNLLFWSPDSRFIAFVTAGKLRKVEASGGPPQPVCDLPGNYRGGAWNSDGVIVFATTTGTYRVSAAGGNPTRLVAIDASRQETQHSGPVFLPDQQHFLYRRNSSALENSGLYLGSLDAKPEQPVGRPLLLSQGDAVYAPSSIPNTGYLLFLREGTLMAQNFDTTKLEFTGEAVPLAEGVGNNFTRGFFSAALTGALVFRGGGMGGNRQYTWFDRQGKNLGAALEPGVYSDLSLSPDGARAVGDRAVSGAPSDLWILDFARGVSTQFTFDPAADNNPVWSPDGTHIAFDSVREGSRNLYQKVSTGAGTDELLLKSPEDKRPKDWSRDGKYLLYAVANPKTGADLFALPVTGEKKPIPVVATEAAEDQGQFSPDSRWVAYKSDAGGRNEIYVRPFPPTENGGQWKVSNAGGAQPRWNSSGKELFYIAPDGKLMAAEVSTVGGTFKSGTPQPLFDSQVFGGGNTAGAIRWDLTPDGKKFLIITQVTEATSSPMTVILNWPALLKR
jgi:serine/threonine protein kinase/Tol biopolymer transport system component